MPLLMDDTSTCLAHMATSFNRDVIRPLLAEFCGVENETAGTWLNHNTLPRGEQLLKLRFFMQFAGYEVDELTALPKIIRDLASLVAVDFMSVQEVTDYLKYRKEQNLYRVILRGEGVLSDKQARIRHLLEVNDVELKRKRAAWQARIQMTLGTIESAKAAVATPNIREVTDIVMVADHLVAALSALLSDAGRNGVSAGSPLPEHIREAIHECIGDERVNRLIEQLNMLP